MSTPSSTVTTDTAAEARCAADMVGVCGTTLLLHVDLVPVQLEIGEQLGRGRFGYVYYGVRRASDQTPTGLAVKMQPGTDDAHMERWTVTRLRLDDPEHMERVCAELGMASSGLCQYFGSATTPINGRTYLVLLMQLYAGNLMDLRGTLTESELWEMAGELAGALEYFHRGVRRADGRVEYYVHRDIHAMNIFVSGDRRGHLGDFGWTGRYFEPREGVRALATDDRRVCMHACTKCPIAIFNSTIEQSPYCTQTLRARTCVYMRAYVWQVLHRVNTHATMKYASRTDRRLYCASRRTDLVTMVGAVLRPKLNILKQELFSLATEDRIFDVLLRPTGWVQGLLGPHTINASLQTILARLFEEHDSLSGTGLPYGMIRHVADMESAACP